jgi:thiol:disulfide interchange protein DsbC
MRILKLIILLVLLMAPGISEGKEVYSGDCASCHSLSVKDAGELVSSLNVKVTSVTLSPMHGFFEVSAERDGKVGIIFVDFAKKYLLQGVMVKIADLQPATSKSTEISDVNKLLRVNAILMGNANASKQIVVFSDPDCPFCRKMHQELQKLSAEIDIAVYVKPYPLEIHPEAYKKAQAILEANSLEILNKAFAGDVVPDPKDGNNKAAVEDIIGLAKSLGIKGTPAVLLPNGKIETGFRTAAALKKLLNL